MQWNGMQWLDGNEFYGETFDIFANRFGFKTIDLEKGFLDVKNLFY